MGQRKKRLERDQGQKNQGWRGGRGAKMMNFEALPVKHSHYTCTLYKYTSCVCKLIYKHTFAHDMCMLTNTWQYDAYQPLQSIYLFLNYKS